MFAATASDTKNVPLVGHPRNETTKNHTINSRIILLRTKTIFRKGDFQEKCKAKRRIGYH